jgi:hypothetical protein
VCELRRASHDRGPVSEYWLTSLFRGLPTTAAQLREDRILDEARAAAGDPLHTAAMFGLTARPALRYAKTIWQQHHANVTEYIVIQEVVHSRDDEAMRTRSRRQPEDKWSPRYLPTALLRSPLGRSREA